jgi:hypothetical protein
MDTYWTSCGIETETCWTDRDIIVPYLGIDYTLRAETKQLAPSIAFECGTKGIS